MRAFISYSHHDADALKRLHVHLSSLRREGRIEEWFDREILAGDVIDAEISKELEAADLFLLLVSPDFIASDYCVEREMQLALQRHEAGEARVVPIIVEPCDWMSMQSLRRLKALPEDAVPISDWANANTAYLNIVQELRRITDMSKEPASANEATSTEAANTRLGVPRYRVKRDFDEIDRSDFRDAAFATIKNYFHRATSEINTIDGLRGRFIDKGIASFGCTVINKGRQQGTSHITVHCRNSSFVLGDIYFSYEENAADNSANGGLNVSSDEYEQFLEPAMMMLGGEPERMNAEEASEYLWNSFIEQAGIAHA